MTGESLGWHSLTLCSKRPHQQHHNNDIKEVPRPGLAGCHCHSLPSITSPLIQSIMRYFLCFNDLQINDPSNGSFARKYPRRCCLFIYSPPPVSSFIDPAVHSPIHPSVCLPVHRWRKSFTPSFNDLQINGRLIAQLDLTTDGSCSLMHF